MTTTRGYSGDVPPSATRGQATRAMSRRVVRRSRELVVLLASVCLFVVG
jgi:hypothetical protein